MLKKDLIISIVPLLNGIDAAHRVLRGGLLIVGAIAGLSNVAFAQAQISPATTTAAAAMPTNSAYLALPANPSAPAIPSAPVITPPPPVSGTMATGTMAAGTMASGAMATETSAGIKLPAPPPATAFSTDPAQLAAQAANTAAQAQAQAQMQLQMEEEQRHREEEHNTKSYDRAASGLLPLSPDQVRGFMHKLEQTQDASVSPFAGQPKGEVRIATLSLDPGVSPPQINLAAGYVTTINMVDASGEPWPILDVGVGGNFEVSPTQSGSHVVRVMPLSRVGSGNLSVLLKDLPTPVIFRLGAGGPSVDLRYDARIGKMGPGAKAPLIQHPRIEAGSESMMLILENAPPTEAKPMKVSGVDARTKAWMMGDHVMVRTSLTLLSPAWNASVSSGDGTTVYDIGDAPVLLMSDNGAMVRAQLVRDDDHDK